MATNYYENTHYYGQVWFAYSYYTMLLWKPNYCGDQLLWKPTIVATEYYGEFWDQPDSLVDEFIN